MKCPFLPHVISDGRAYQEYIVKSLQDKLNALNNQLETVVRESNTEINRLDPSIDRLTGLWDRSSQFNARIEE